MLRDRLISTDPVLLTKCKAATNVLALSHDLQVVWIDTRTDSTQVVQTHSFARPLLSIHHAARTWLRACHIDRCPTWVVRHVEGMNWNKPDAPDGFRAYGFQPDSHLGTRRSQDACQPPIRCRRMIHSTHVRGRLLSHFLDNTRTPHS